MRAKSVKKSPEKLVAKKNKNKKKQLAPKFVGEGIPLFEGGFKNCQGGLPALGKRR